MQLKNIKTRVTKQKLTKCSMCRTYNDIAFRFAMLLENDTSVSEFSCNIELTGLNVGDGRNYTSDFLITYMDGRMAVRECINRDAILRAKNIKLLDASKEYWEKRGITDWGLVINKEA